MGALWMLVAGLLFALMGVLIKLGSTQFSSNEIVFYRSFFGLILVVLMMLHNKTSHLTSQWRGHLWRSFSGTIAMMLFFYCLTVLPLATAITLNYTSSLFLTVLTLIVFKDHFHLPVTVSLGFGFCGVVLLLHPTFEHEQFASGLMGLASGFLGAVALLNVRQLGKQGEPAVRIVFYLNLVATLFSGIWMTQINVHVITIYTLPILIGIGTSATLAQIALTRAYNTGHTQVVSSLSFSTIAFGSLFGLILWKETLSFSGWIGIALIIASGMLSLKLSPKHEA